VSGRHGRRPPGSPDDPEAATEAEAIETARVIAGLRARLGRLEILGHPLVQGELHKLEEQVTVLLDQADQNPGKHRSPNGGAPGEQIGDADGYDLKPDPLAATTPAEFITTLWQYRAWSGDPSWRKMAARAGHMVVHSTMHTAMHSDSLPKFEVMKAIIIGCGGDADLRAFATSWRRIESATARRPVAGPGLLTAPLPAAFHQLSPAGHQLSPAGHN
jgi:hypothetical protein